MAGFAPAPAASPSPIVRQGSKLIVPAPLPGQAAVLPPLCVKCGAAADGKPVDKTYYWHHPALYVLLLSPLIYVIVALIVRKTMRVRLQLCAGHAKRRSTAVTLSWVLPLAGIADIFVLMSLNVNQGVIALVSIVLMLSGLVIWAVVNSPIRPTMIDSTRGEFTGACAAFLEHVPEAALPGPATLQQGVPPPPVR
ncbi:MAG TPA: hypothetical protein VKE93_02575 [Candidatus Angelobacter sp.]|nr:hypothetical protein [Candidatus Angelobacter sp.]